jgi:hypothetical protein
VREAPLFGYEASVERVPDKINLTMKIKFPHHVSPVHFRCSLTYEKLSGDLGVALALHDKLEDFPLARRECFVQIQG